MQYFRPSPRRNSVPGGVCAVEHKLWNAMLFSWAREVLARMEATKKPVAIFPNWF